MEIMPLDNFTHKWNGNKWEPVAVDVPNVLAQISVHPESPALGQQWMDSPVSFYKVKLTSDSMDQEDCMLLRPMRRYLPRLHIVPVNPESEKTVALNGPNVKIFSFPQTEFYAVTSYQNPQITQLKIDCNPFAMAFREDTQSIRLLKDKLGLCSSVSSPFQSPLLSLARGLGVKRKEGAVKSTDSTCIQNNRKRDLYPGSVSLEEEEGIFTKIRNNTKLNCPNNIPLCQENTDYNKNNVHMAPLDVEPCVTETLEETLSSTNEPLPSISSTENPNISQTFEDAVNTQINDTHSESPTHFSVPEIKAAGSPPRSPFLNDSHVQVHKPGHLCRRKYNRRRRKAKAKWWSKTKYSKPLPDVVPLKAPLQPDLEDVEGMLFVSFVAKEALNIPVENREEGEQAPPLLCPTHDQSENLESEDVSFSLKEKIATLEKSLLCHLKQQKHRQVIHPCLQDVGMKMSLLDLNSVIDLQYLGVHLPLPPPIHEDFDQINPMKLSSSPDAAGCFVSRTGKTNDPTKIKGWREKFQDNTVQNAQEIGFKNSSAFCSEMLDAYLENEAQQISDRLAVFSKFSASPVSYQLPSKSSSYVVTLDSLLKNRSISANKVYSKPAGEILPKSPLKRSRSIAVPLSSAGVQQKLHRSREKGRKFVHSYQSHQHVVSKLPGRRSTRFVSRSSMRKQPGKSQLTQNSSAGTGRHLNSVQSRVISVKKGTVLQRIEEEAIFLGKVRTHVTTKRANFALTSLFNFQKPRRRRFPFYYKEKNVCPKDVCLLGCICDSLAREVRGPTHCRRVECMFDCSCFKHKVLLLHPPKETANIQRGRKRAVLAFPIADPERESRPPPPPIITTLWKRTEGNDDPEPLFVPASPIFSKNVSRQVQKEDKGFVYQYFESMMTCARVREYNSNPPPQIHMFPTKKEIKEQLNEIADANKPPSQTTPETNPAEPKPIKLLEILSECNWEPHRNLVLNALFRHMNSDLLSEPFCFGMYKIRLLSTTAKGADRCFTIMYKVCISRADEKEMTNDLQPQVKKTPRNQCLKKGFKNKVSKICETQTQKADTGSGQIRSDLVETQQQKPSPHKRLIRDVPSLTHIAHDGHLRAVKSKPGIHTKGLIKVNGKTYNRAKLLLGQLGALHPVNRFAAFVTGRHLPVPQDQNKIVDEKGKACPPKAPRKPSLLTKVGKVSNQTPSNRVVGRPPLANAPGPNHASKNKGAIKTPLNATPKLVGKPPVVPDGSRFLLVPISPSNFVPAPSSETANSSTLPPGQQVVLQPAPGMPGSHFICQYNGQMIQLKPLSSGPVANTQPSSVSGDSTSQITQTANTSLPKETKSLQNPLNFTPQMLPNHFPVNPPKVLSLSAKSGINIASGTPAFNLQSSFPGKTGMFSFRICPPTSDVKSVGSEHDVKPPEASVYSPTLALPGGFTLIKLFPPAVTSAASHRTELPQNHDSMTKSLSQSFSSSLEQNFQDSESISSTFLPSNCNSAPQPTAEISQSSNDFPLEIAIKDEPVEPFSESVHLEPSGKYDWVSEDAEMVHKNISKSEPTDDWPQNETDRILWIDSDDEEENNGFNKEPKNLDVVPKSSAAEDPSKDACSKSSDVDQSRSSMSNYDLENDCALNVNAKNNLNTANINKHEQTYNKTVADTKLSHISFGSSKMVEQDMIQGNCPPVDIKNEPYSEPPEMDMSGNKLDFENQDQVGHRTLCIGKIEAYSKQAGKNTLLDPFLTKDQKLFSHNEVTMHHIGSEDILPIMNKEETSISQRMGEFSSYLNKQGLGSKNSFHIRNHEENYSPVKTLASLHAGDSQENIDIAPCPLLNGQTPVMNTPSTAHLLNTKQDLKGMTIRTERFESNTELRELSDDEDIVVDVINLSENEDEGPTDKFDRDTNTSIDDSEEDSDSDKEDSSSVSTSDSDTVGVSSEDYIDVESFEDSDVKIINTMKSQTRHKIDKRTTAKLKEQHCTSVVSTSICEQEKRQNHTEKERVRRGEMRQQFSALEKALNVDGQVRMCKHDILNQARLVIRALENRGHYLENKKKILHQRQSAYLSRILLLSGEKSGSGKDRACFEINCKQQTWSESTHSLQSSAPGPLVNLRRLDSDGNRLPPRLGCWKAPNYIRKRAKKALVQPSVTTTVVADKNLDSPLSPDTQGSQTVSRPLPLVKTENLVWTLIAQNPTCLPSLCKTPQQKSLLEPKKTGMVSLPKIVLQSSGNTDAVKLMHDVRTPRPSSTEVSDPAELIKDCNLDLQNQNKEAEKCDATRDANVVNTPVYTSELKKDEQAEVKLRRKKRAKCDVVIDEDLSNPEVLEPRQLRQRTPVVEGATGGSIKKRRRRII